MQARQLEDNLSFDILARLLLARGRRPEAPRLGVAELAARRGRYSSKSLGRASGGDVGEGHADLDGRLGAAPGRRGPRGPIRDTIPKSPARPTVSPVGDDAALWCFVSLRRAAPTKTKAPGVEAVEAAPGPRRHGWAAEALSFAQHSRIDHACGSRQPPQPGQPEQSARPEGEGRDQVR